MAEIALHNLHKVYPGSPPHAPAVRDLSLRIPDGALLALLGPSGCGKTTTLRMIAGLEAPTAGEILIAGRPVNALPPRDRDVAMVFQSHALYPHLSVFHNMALPLRMRRVPRAEIERRVHAAAAMLGLSDLLHRRPAHLSGGQRQRVALGRAIVREPAAFLFDEPLSSLDPRLRLSTRTELKALLTRLGATTLYVTHDQEEAMSLGDIIAVMDAGALQQVGPPLDLYRAPANRFVAAFIGSPPMNLIPGRIERGSTVHSGGSGGDRGGDAPDLVFIADAPGADPRAVIPIPQRLTTAAAAHIGRPATLGVRPHALRPGPADPTCSGISITITAVEHRGDAIDLVGATPAGTLLAARIPPDTPARPGDRVALHITDPTHTHLFEPGDHGRNLLLT